MREGGGNDGALVGGPGNDNNWRLLTGKTGLYGGPGNDVLNGGSGTDSADGGPNFDACVNVETEINCEA